MEFWLELNGTVKGTVKGMNGIYRIFDWIGFGFWVLKKNKQISIVLV
jgi:hypothetical protein